MASSSRRLRPRRLALVALLLAGTLSGCWTGRIFQAGRVRESALEIHAAGLTQSWLRLDYRARLEGGGSGGRLEPRAVRIELAALRAQPEHPVDAFPLERVPPDTPEPGGVPLAIVFEARGPTQGAHTAAAGSTEAMLVRVQTDAHGNQLLRLCPPTGACIGQLYSAALYRDRTAWWVYPLLPLGVVVDAALLPLQLVTTAPFFLAGD